ncbi:MAG: ExbD/TolR family protein [Paracoccaceae bacterium]
MRRRKRTTRREPTIALINIVFLMLIFFLVAGTLTPPLDEDLTLIATADLKGREPPDALVLHADGRTSYRGDPVSDIAGFARGLSTEELARLKIVPDRAVDASALVALSRNLRAAGAETVVIVTEQALP